MLNNPERPVLVSLRTAAPQCEGLARSKLYDAIMIESGVFLLRSLTASDVTPRFVEWLNAGQMLQGLNLAHLDFTADSLRNFIKTFDNYHHYFIGIFDMSTDLLLGFYTIDVNRQHRVGNLTTGVGEIEKSGKHVLWATIDALIDHFYANLGVEKFTARILARNLRMLFSFRENPRFVLEAHLKQECLGADDKRVDIVCFASYKNDGLPLKPASQAD